MSTEARLDRLGLLHLIDKPDKLAKALEQKREELKLKQNRQEIDEKKAQTEYVKSPNESMIEFFESLPKGSKIISVKVPPKKPNSNN